MKDAEEKEGVGMKKVNKKRRGVFLEQKSKVGQAEPPFFCILSSHVILKEYSLIDSIRSPLVALNWQHL